MSRFGGIAVLVVCSITAFAGSIPTYTMAQGSAGLTSIDVKNFSIAWSFSNGSGSGVNLSAASILGEHAWTLPRAAPPVIQT